MQIVINPAARRFVFLHHLAQRAERGASEHRLFNLVRSWVDRQTRRQEDWRELFPEDLRGLTVREASRELARLAWEGAARSRRDMVI